MTAEAAQIFGTGGSPSAGVTAISPTTITLTTDWEPFAAVLTIPSISGKTLGTDGKDHLEINFWTSAGSDFNSRTNSLGVQTIGVDLWGIHIKRGTHTADATEAYRAPELGPELARCQRYHEKGAVSFGVYMTSGGFINNSIVLKCTKRDAPSISLSNTVLSSVSGLTVDRVTQEEFRLFAQSTSTGAVAFSASWVADAEL
jgi:hypothetical protein